MTITEQLRHFRQVKPTTPFKGQRRWSALCPGHDDHHPSLVITEGKKRAFFTCRVGCDEPAILAGAGLKLEDVWYEPAKKTKPTTTTKPTSAAKPTVAAIATAKQLPVTFLKSLGLRDVKNGVEVPYHNLDGTPARPRVRVKMAGPNHYIWGGKNGTPCGAYTLGLADARAEKFTFIVEGESDSWTLRFLSYHAIGLPGNTTDDKLLPEHVEGLDILYIVQEHGAPGVKFITRVQERLKAIGWAGTAVVIRMPDGLKDISDLWCDSQAAIDGDRWVLFITRLDQAIKDGTAFAITPGLIGARAGRPPMIVKHLDPADPEHDLSLLTSAAWSLVKGINAPPWPWIFRNGDALVRIERDDSNHPFFHEVNGSLLRYELAEHIEFIAEKAGLVPGSTVNVPVPPPPILVDNLLATPAPPVPRCRRIVTTPVFSSDYRLVDQPGYDANALLFYEPPAEFSLPPIPDRPTAGEIAAAGALLLEPFDEFPFKDPKVGRANILGAILTSFARDLFDGPTPLNLVMKPTPGVGSTLVVRAMGIIMTGTEPAMAAPCESDAEWRKRITTLLIRAPQVVVLDNLRKLDSPSLAAALTMDRWKDRLLGGNEETELPIRCTWLGTGNNIRLTTEQFRRTVRIDLMALSERPWLSGIDYRHKFLIEWVKLERARLVAAALTLVRAWIVAGRPAGDVTLGSFESWAATVGGILAVAGVEGFLGNIMETDVMDDETGDIKALLELWWKTSTDKDHIALANELFSMADDPGVALELPGATEHQRRSAFGLLLKKHQDRVFDLEDVTVKLVRPKATTHAKQARWQLVGLERGGVRVGAGGFSSRGGREPQGLDRQAGYPDVSKLGPQTPPHTPAPPRSPDPGVSASEAKTPSHPLAPPRGLDPDDPKGDLEEPDDDCPF